MSKSKPRRRTKSAAEEESVSISGHVGTPARQQEQLLIDRIPTLDGPRVVCNTAGRGQFARELAAEKPQVSVTCLFLDQYQRQQSERDDAIQLPNLQRVCQPDLPADEVDLAIVFCSAHGIAELSRDLLQQAHDRLAKRGRLIASIDNPEDQWLHDELHKLFDKVTREPSDEGVVYSAIKSGPLTKHKNFDAEFVFRDRDRLITMHSRPGVFSHRRLDTGAAAAADYSSGTVVFTQTKGGLMAEASIGGQKFTYRPL